MYSDRAPVLNHFPQQREGIRSAASFFVPQPFHLPSQNVKRPNRLFSHISTKPEIMKPTTKRISFLPVASAIAALFAGPSARAADVIWDTTPGTVGAGDSAVTGGAGNWDTLNGNWTSDSGANNIAWDNANNDTAIFGDTAGTVTLNTGITVGGLTFDIAGYTVTGNTLTFGIAGNITANADATISSILAGAAITKTGMGTLVFSGANTYTGTTISAGTLQIGAGGHHRDTRLRHRPEQRGAQLPPQQPNHRGQRDQRQRQCYKSGGKPRDYGQ